MAIDPICGMTVDEETAAGSLSDDGRVFYFCSTGCLRQFAAKIKAIVRLTNNSTQIGTICEIHGPVVDIVCDRLPAPPPGHAISRFAYPLLLNLAAPKFFAEPTRHYLWAQMHDIFYGSLMAENRRRLQHMEGAMQHMEENVGGLQRKYNLLHQEEITEEIEIIMLSNDALHKNARSNNNSLSMRWR